MFFHVATEETKKWAGLGAERGWGSTMVVTEPDAGSDVGAGRTKAVKQDDGSWHIDGVKRFITSGDTGDLFENIAHLVLARPEGAGPGTKGLSLCLVRKYHFDHDTGEIGERNGVFVTGLEHKMGLKASASCELTFGQHGTPAVGRLGDRPHKGNAPRSGGDAGPRPWNHPHSLATRHPVHLRASLIRGLPQPPHPLDAVAYGS